MTESTLGDVKYVQELIDKTTGLIWMRSLTSKTRTPAKELCILMNAATLNESTNGTNISAQFHKIDSMTCDPKAYAMWGLVVAKNHYGVIVHDPNNRDYNWRAYLFYIPKLGKFPPDIVCTDLKLAEEIASNKPVTHTFTHVWNPSDGRDTVEYKHRWVRELVRPTLVKPKANELDYVVEFLIHKANVWMEEFFPPPGIPIEAGMMFAYGRGPYTYVAELIGQGRMIQMTAMPNKKYLETHRYAAPKIPDVPKNVTVKKVTSVNEARIIYRD